ncbi:MAG: response regulator [Bacteroidetes bacterium]|nr:response regulator [Bacteroidota bacterium]
MNNSIILVVEDDLSYSDLVQFQLTTIGCSAVNIISVQSIAEVQEVKLEIDPDVILLDLNILDSNGINTYNQVSSIYPDASLIVLSGMDDQTIALEIVSRGAPDYILKSEVKPQILEKTINYAMLRKSMLQRIAFSEKRYREVFEKSPLPMFQLSGEDFQIEMVNTAALQFYGFNADYLIGKSFGILSKNRVLAISENNSIRIIQITQNLTEKTVDVILNRIHENEEVFIALVIDKTEELLFEKNKYQIISQAEEGEKKKIARELHDGLGQQMVLLNLLFQNFTPSDEQRAQYQDLGNLLQSCIREVKDIAYNLLPPELEKGFINAMDRFANRINNIGMVDFKLEIDENITEDLLNAVDKFNLYRLVQEVVNNAIKHSKSKDIIFRMRLLDEYIETHIIDQGVGFDLEKVSQGLGIQNIYHRLKLANLDGEFNATPGNGTSVTFKIPLH